MLKINFLPPGLRPKLVLNLDAIFMVVLVVMLFAGAGLFFSVQSKTRASKQELAGLEARVGDQRKTIEELKSREAQRDLSATQSLAAKRIKWNPFLKELTYLLPRDVWITKMSVKSSGESIDMQLVGLAPSQKSVNRFLGTLERAASYQNVRLNNSTMRTDYTPVLYAFDFSIEDLLGIKAGREPAGK